MTPSSYSQLAKDPRLDVLFRARYNCEIDEIEENGNAQSKKRREQRHIYRAIKSHTDQLVRPIHMPNLYT